MPVLRRLLSNVNQRCAQGNDELLSVQELPDYLASVDEEAAQNAPKIQRLQAQLSAALHQFFRRRWPCSQPDWSPEEKARGLDRPSANRTKPGSSLDLSSVGVPYLNAAWIPALAVSAPPYVVTQHPLPGSILHFWKMTLSVQPLFVLMLNGAIEAEDLDVPPYWLPERVREAVELAAGDGGDADEPELSVDEAALSRLQEVLGPELEEAEVTLRPLICRWTSRQMEWRGCHMIVSWWKDQSAPPMDKFLALERLVDKLRRLSVSEDPANLQRPIVVHCAGGIGRAGVFVAADSGARALASGTPEAGCSPDHLIAGLRRCRTNMVQTAEQYEFLHLVLPRLAQQFANDL